MTQPWEGVDTATLIVNAFFWIKQDVRKEKHDNEK